MLDGTARSRIDRSPIDRRDANARRRVRRVHVRARHVDTHPAVEEIRVVIVVVIIISARRWSADECEVDARGGGGGVSVVDVLIRVRLRVIWCVYEYFIVQLLYVLYGYPSSRSSHSVFVTRGEILMMNDDDDDDDGVQPGVVIDPRVGTPRRARR